MKVTLLAWTPAPELVVAAAGKQCYSAAASSEILKEITPVQAEKFIRQIKRSGHSSVLEHASFTFCLEGVSRSLLAQLTRHRIASFSVSSQRYINLSGVDYVMPEAIKNCVRAREIFDQCRKDDLKAYEDIHAYLISEALREKYAQYVTHEGLNVAFQNDGKFFYLALDVMMEKIHNAEDATDEDQILYAQYKRDRNAAEKYANENARAVLPNAAATNITMTMNARELLHFFRLRCCNRAQDEIRSAAQEMLKLCKQVAPTIFEDAGAPCVSGACPEGKMTCGNPQKPESTEVQ